MLSPRVLQVLAFLFGIAAVIVAILNLKRVADLGMIGLPAFLIVVAAGLMAAARRRKRQETEGQESFHR